MSAPHGGVYIKNPSTHLLQGGISHDVRKGSQDHRRVQGHRRVTIKPESTFQELGIDSLDTVELIMSFEDTFGGTIEMSPDLKTVQDIVNLIDAQA